MSAAFEKDYALEASALQWLRYDKRCPIVSVERSVFHHYYRPDVSGVNRRGQVTEIEVKRTYADFRADFKKRHVANRNRAVTEGMWSWLAVNQFYYLLHPQIVDRCEAEILPFYGILTIHPAYIEGYVGLHPIKVIRPAKSFGNRIKSKLTIVRAVETMSATLVRTEAHVLHLKDELERHRAQLERLRRYIASRPLPELLEEQRPEVGSDGKMRPLWLEGPEDVSSAGGTAPQAENVQDLSTKDGEGRTFMTGGETDAQTTDRSRLQSAPDGDSGHRMADVTRV